MTKYDSVVSNATHLLCWMHDMDLVLALLAKKIVSRIFILSLSFSFRILEVNILETWPCIQHRRWADLFIIYLQYIKQKINCFKMLKSAKTSTPSFRNDKNCLCLYIYKSILTELLLLIVLFRLIGVCSFVDDWVAKKQPTISLLLVNNLSIAIP